MSILEAFVGSRKFTIMLLLIVAGIALRIAGLLESPDFASVLSSVGVAFMGSNAVERITDAAKDWLVSKGGSDAGQ